MNMFNNLFLELMDHVSPSAVQYLEEKNSFYM